MASSTRSTYEGPKLSGPGILYSSSKISRPSELSEEVYHKWYNTIHIPDVLGTGGVTAAYRFKNTNPKADRPYLAVYQVPDLAVIETQRFKDIPMNSNLLPGNGHCHEYIDFDTRFYRFEQDHNTKGDKGDEHWPILLLAAMQPGDKPGEAEELDAWYRKEHLEQMAREPGWRRARRYKLVFQVEDVTKASADNEAPSELALYDFDESATQLGTEVKPLDPMTEWTKRCMAAAKGIEAGIYHRIGMFKP